MTAEEIMNSRKLYKVMELILESKGQDYRNTPFLQVYGHADDPCPHCGNLLQRTVIGERSSVYCSSCQVESVHIHKELLL